MSYKFNVFTSKFDLVNPSDAVSDVSNSDGTLIISPTTGSVIASINLAQANIWTTTIEATAFISDQPSGFPGLLIVQNSLQDNNVVEIKDPGGDPQIYIDADLNMFVNYTLTSVSQLAVAGGLSDITFSSGGNGQVLTSTGSGVLWATLVNSLHVLSITPINAKVTGATTLYTVPTGKTAIITSAVIRCSAATAITNGPTIGIGTATGTNDIFALAAANALTTTTTIFGFSLVGMSVKVATGTAIKLNVGTASTGTSQTITVDLIGYIF